MASLGTFGAAVREFDPDGEHDTFEFFGETFTVEGVIPPMLMVHLGAAIAGKAGQMEGNAAIWQALRSALSKPDHVGADGKRMPEDDTQFARFYRLAVLRKDDEDDLLALVLTLIGAQAGKADAPSPTSPPGSPSPSTSSNSSASATPASPGLRSVDEVLAG